MGPNQREKPLNIAEFIAKWRKVELKERSAAQEHFLDLCRLLEHPTPAEADPAGESFCFEKGVHYLRGAKCGRSAEDLYGMVLCGFHAISVQALA